MSSEIHHAVVEHIARTRFPFPGQTTWPADYITLTNVPVRRHGIETSAGVYYPDIVIIDGQGRTREIGEVEMVVNPAAIPRLHAGSEAADDNTPTRVRHFFVYAPAGLEAAAQQLLDTLKVSYAGVRGFARSDDGTIRIVPFVTKGDRYDHQ